MKNLLIPIMIISFQPSSSLTSFYFSFLIYARLCSRHTPIVTFFFNTLQWFFLFPIWPWFPSHLTYLVFFPHPVNIGDFSFSCATSPPLGNLTYFHSFNYCNVQNHISYILVASPPILEPTWWFFYPVTRGSRALDQQLQHHLGTYQQCTFPGPSQIYQTRNSGGRIQKSIF